MEVVTLIIAVVALVLAAVAFTRSGGVQDLRQQLHTLAAKTDSARDTTADVLDRLEQLVRGRERRGPGDTGQPSGGGPAGA